MTEEEQLALAIQMSMNRKETHYFVHHVTIKPVLTRLSTLITILYH